MTLALEGRVERLEDDTAGDDELGELTHDELMILRWCMARDSVADPKTPPGERAAGQRRIEDVEADIVAQAAQIASPIMPGISNGAAHSGRAGPAGTIMSRR